MKTQPRGQTSNLAPARALRNGPRSDADQLRWALTFAQADMSGWREGDWLNALEDLKWLITPMEGGPERESETALASLALYPIGRRGQPKRLDVAQIKAWLTPLQRALHDFLKRLDKGRKEVVAAGAAAAGVPVVKLPFSGEAIVTTTPPFRRLQLYYAPKKTGLRDQLASGVVLRVADLLTRVELGRLKRCPECGRLFLAVRRQRFDTAQCSLRDRVRRFRQGKGSKRGRRTKETTR